MQPGKGLGGTRESISRCGDADIFSHIQYPQRKTMAMSQVVELDTLESEEARLLNQMLGLSVNKSLSIFFKGTKLFVKGLFLPAHFFLFRMPKWVIVKLSPKIVLLANHLKELKENLTKFIQNMAAKMNVMKSLSLVLKPFSQLLSASFQRLAQNFLSPFKKMNSLVKERINEVTHMMSKAFSLVGSTFHKMQNLFKKSLKMAKREKGVETKSFDFKKRLKQASLFVKTRVGSPLAKHLANWQTRINQEFDKARHVLRSSNKAFLKRTKPVVDSAKNQLQKAVNVCNRIKNKVIDIAAPKIEAVQQQIQKAIETLKPPIYAAVQFVEGIKAQAVQLFLRNPMLQKFKSQVTSLKRITVKIQKAHTAILKSFQRLGSDAKKSLKKWTKEKGAIVKEFAHQQKKRAISVFKKIAIILNAIKVYFLHYFKKLVRFFVLLLKWCRIMIKFTGYLIREIIREARKA